MYDIPPIHKIKPTPTAKAHNFAPPVVKKEVGARSADVPVRVPRASPPAWLERLAAHKPRPFRPWDKSLYG